MQTDDVLIDDLLNKTETLRNVTEDILNFFNTSNKNNNKNSGFEERFLTDMCSAISETLNDTMNVLYDKACHVETLVSDLPSLDAVDELMLFLCGQYCLHNECLLSFPYKILVEYEQCLLSEERMNKEGNTSSDAYVEVNVNPFMPRLFSRQTMSSEAYVTSIHSDIQRNSE